MHLNATVVLPPASASRRAAAHLSDRDLLDVTTRVAADERHLTADLLALLGELDARRLYLGHSCASLFTYCTQVLHFSEHAAYHRIEAARAARQFPVILELVADGAVTLTTVTMLRPHLTRENHVAVLDAARHKSKREVEQQIACLAPRPDGRPIVRKLPTTGLTPGPMALFEPTANMPAFDAAGESASPKPAQPVAALLAQPRARATVAPLSPDRCLLKVTLSAETHATLRRAQDLMRHTIPNGDPALVLDRALKLLVDELERTKAAKAPATASTARSERTPRSLTVHRRARRHRATSQRRFRRTVWARDEGRCAFVGARGRCTEDVPSNSITSSRSPTAARRASRISRCAARRTMRMRRKCGRRRICGPKRQRSGFPRSAPWHESCAELGPDRAATLGDQQRSLYRASRQSRASRLVHRGHPIAAATYTSVIH